MIIEHFGNLPKFNCVIKIVNDIVHIIGTLTNLEFPNFIVANNLKPTEKFFIYWDEIKSLSIAVNNILIVTKEVTEYYNGLIETHQKFTYIDMLLIENKTIGCIPPFYRMKPPLKYNLNNSQLILVLCDEFTRNNFELLDGPPKLYEITSIGNHSGLKFESIFHRELNLLPQHFAQGKHNMQLSCVCYGMPIANQPQAEYIPAREMTSTFVSRPQRFNTHQFEVPPQYSPIPPRPVAPPFNPQQQPTNGSINNNIAYSMAGPSSPFLPTFAQNNVPPFWIQNDSKPFFVPLY